MANFYNPYNSRPASAVMITSDDIDCVLRMAKQNVKGCEDFIDELISINKEMASFTDSITDEEAFILLQQILAEAEAPAD